MKKRSLIVILAVLCIATSCFVSSTFAKYTSEATLTSSKAVVAAWSIEVEGEDIAVAAPTATFDLFSTINDTKDSAAETDVKTGLIAPGTKGSFTLNITNNSDVNATYKIELTETVTGIADLPIQYSADGGVTWKDSIAELNVAATDIAMNGGTAELTIDWQWVFDGDHTEIGKTAVGGDVNVQVSAKITVDQVD